MVGFVGWFFKRKQEKQDVLAAQLDNANGLLKYYQGLCDDLGNRLTNAIEQLNKANEELRLAKLKMEEMEKTVGELTSELSKYKQLNGKKP